MMRASRQRGVALFTAIFLIAVIAIVAVAVAQVLTTQHLSSARALQTEQAYYAAQGRLDLAVAEVLDDGIDCTDLPRTEDHLGIEEVTTDCTCDTVDDGDGDEAIYTLTAGAETGSRSSGSLVRRTVRAQVNAEGSCPGEGNGDE